MATETIKPIEKLSGEALLRALDEARAESARLRQELEASKTKAKNGSLVFKVSAKGALSVYGLGRFPVTLYRGQWERLMAKVEDLKSYIKANEGSLKTKGEE